jgi:hypothetical protein
LFAEIKRLCLPEINERARSVCVFQSEKAEQTVDLSLQSSLVYIKLRRPLREQQQQRTPSFAPFAIEHYIIHIRDGARALLGASYPHCKFTLLIMKKKHTFV